MTKLTTRLRTIRRDASLNADEVATIDEAIQLKAAYDALAREYAIFRRDRQEQMTRVRNALDDAYRGARTGNLITPLWVVQSIDDARSAGGWTLPPQPTDLDRCCDIRGGAERCADCPHDHASRSRAQECERSEFARDYGITDPGCPTHEKTAREHDMMHETHDTVQDGGDGALICINCACCPCHRPEVASAPCEKQDPNT